MGGQEMPISFSSGENELIGVLHPGSETAQYGVLFVVGGPQYRIGSHRSYVTIARRLAENGIPCLRFDHSGIGDSSGSYQGFDRLDGDIRAAIDWLTERKSSIRKIVLFGLCDSASAALMYAATDKRVSAMILVNPWIRSDPNRPEFPIRQYYLPRLFSGDFWGKDVRGLAGLVGSIGEIFRVFTRATVTKFLSRRNSAPLFVERMRRGFESFSGHVLLILSGRDVTGQEFRELVRTDREWQSAFRHTLWTEKQLPDADHTVSSTEDLETLINICARWLKERSMT